MYAPPELIERARAVLKQNDQGKWTVPATGFYPHQWLWDSCFIAIGMRHYDPRRAMVEINSLFRGQWQNGMLPHIILSETSEYWEPPEFWQSDISPIAPKNIATSGLTQPPLPAIAALAVAEKLEPAEAEVFLKNVFPRILAYHRWIYNERDSANTGLAILLSPLETGLDNTPPWIELLKKLSPLWIGVLLKLGIDSMLKRFRRDVKLVNVKERSTNIDVLKAAHLTYQHKKNRYDSRLTISKSRFTVESLFFNSILIAANKALVSIAARIAEEIPSDLTYRFTQTEKALEQLWDEPTGQYYPRRFKPQELIKVSSIATFLPLFSGSISQERAAQLVRLLKDNTKYWPAFPVPSAPIDSPYFSERRYWQGPTWINTNWFIIKGLINYGYTEEANQLKQACIELIKKSGFHEYFSPLDGSGHGIDHFSWSAALLIDLGNLEIN